MIHDHDRTGKMGVYQTDGKKKGGAAGYERKLIFKGPFTCSKMNGQKEC